MICVYLRLYAFILQNTKFMRFTTFSFFATNTQKTFQKNYFSLYFCSLFVSLLHSSFHSKKSSVEDFFSSHSQYNNKKKFIYIILMYGCERYIFAEVYEAINKVLRNQSKVAMDEYFIPCVFSFVIIFFYTQKIVSFIFLYTFSGCFAS